MILVIKFTLYFTLIKIEGVTNVSHVNRKIEGVTKRGKIRKRRSQSSRMFQNGRKEKEEREEKEEGSRMFYGVLESFDKSNKGYRKL